MMNNKQKSILLLKKGMVASMHITITGNLGSGKSTISKIIQEKYGFEIYSTGTIQNWPRN